MADEKIEKQVEFILEHQTQFTAKMGQLEDIVVRFARATRDRFEATDGRVDDIDERIAALVDSQVRTEEIVKTTAENVKKTAEDVKKTDQALSNLIAVVDRHLTEGRKGNPT